MWSCSGFGAWSAVFPPVHSSNPPDRRGMRFQHTRLRRRPTDLRPWRPPSICVDGESSFGLRRCRQKLDGFESVALYFLLYTAPILRIVEECGFNIHAYADDLQIYAHGDPLRSASMVNRLSDCVDVVKGWMASNRLRLNPTKTEVIWLGSRSSLQHCPKSPLLISGALITPSSQVRNLGVVMDSELSMTAHVNNLVKV